MSFTVITVLSVFCLIWFLLLIDTIFFGKSYVWRGHRNVKERIILGAISVVAIVINATALIAYINA